MFRHVVVGIDEDPGSRDALALARALLDKDGRLTLANVHHGDPRMRTVSPELAAAERTRARRSAASDVSSAIRCAKWATSHSLRNFGSAPSSAMTASCATSSTSGFRRPSTRLTIVNIEPPRCITSVLDASGSPPAAARASSASSSGGACSPRTSKPDWPARTDWTD